MSFLHEFLEAPKIFEHLRRHKFQNFFCYSFTVHQGCNAPRFSQNYSFPIRYLWILLSFRKPSSEALQSLLDKIVNHLPTCKASMMAHDVKGRTRHFGQVGPVCLLCLYCLDAPFWANKSSPFVENLHQLVLLVINKKTHQQIDKNLRGFLWMGIWKIDKNPVHLKASQCDHLWHRSTHLSSPTWHFQDKSEAMGDGGCKGCGGVASDDGSLQRLEASCCNLWVLPFFMLVQTHLSINASRRKVFEFFTNYF